MITKECFYNYIQEYPDYNSFETPYMYYIHPKDNRIKIKREYDGYNTIFKLYINELSGGKIKNIENLLPKINKIVEKAIKSKEEQIKKLQSEIEDFKSILINLYAKD